MTFTLYEGASNKNTRTIENSSIVLADNLWQCDECDFDYHADWICPSCGNKNTCLYLDEYNKNDNCENCKLSVIILIENIELA